MKARTVLLPGLFLLAVVLAVTFSGCNSPPDPWEGTNKPRVVCSFPPLYCFAKNVGGDQVALRCLCTTRGPHDYEYNPKDTLQLRTAHLLLSNGKGMDDHFIDQLQNNSNNGDLRGYKLGEDSRIQFQEMQEHKHTGGAKHHHGNIDPHLWLGIPEAIIMVEGIRDQFIAIDPIHAIDYTANATAYIARLEKLHQEGKQKLAGKKLTIVTFHESLSYFARSFGITIGGSVQGTPGSDPQSARLVELIEKCKASNAYIITTEPQYPETAAETLRASLKKRAGIDAVLVPVDPLETVEEGDDWNQLNAPQSTWYEDKMRRNITNLANAAR